MSQTERVFDILYQLSKSGGNITLKTIAEHYGVSTRQAARDIEYVRYRIMPDPENIIFDRKRRVYRLNDDVSILSRWREDMLVSFAVLRAMSGSAVGKNEIDNNLPLSMRNILSHIDYRVPVKSRGEDEVWLSVVFEAFEKDRSVVIHYRKTPESEMEIRHADPLKLVNYQGFWYLFSYDRDRRALRTFRLSRAEKVLIADEPSLVFSVLHMGCSSVKRQMTGSGIQCGFLVIPHYGSRRKYGMMNRKAAGTVVCMSFLFRQQAL